ncbi:globin domain-containing protein [Alicyclobacillus acidiphilus]|uniref:globin domain-containing protein n=1 Tax=Alicyclobacillus acidiphilus TaxID=182455 RepID=UPI00082CDA7C|nr:globin [Alicyclobacillus acidiphilus]
MDNSQFTTVYDAIGGEPTMRRLIDEFYARVEKNALLRPLFPESFDEVRERQFWFQSQLFGGPKLYSENRGQPMLRARHLPFPITKAHARAWLGCMKEAMAAAGISGPAAEAMMSRLTSTAFHMVNQEDEEPEVDR